MADKRVMFAMVDELSPDDLEELYQHVKQRRQVVSIHKATGTFSAVPAEADRMPAETIRDEVNAVIDEAIDVARRKRKTQEMAQQKS